MKNIDVLVQKQKVGELFFEKESNTYGFNYINNRSPISLIMPYKKSTYLWYQKLHPIFDMNIPEGYLFEVFKNYLNKQHGYIDDFLMFSYLAPNIQSRLGYKSWFGEKTFTAIDIEEVLLHDSDAAFMELLKTFLDKNAISGIQPKTLALIKEKESLSTKEYIIKTWGDEYPNLAQNEYFCLKAVELCGVKIPNIHLSKNKKFLLVERFNYDKKQNLFFGFEEVLVLLGKNKEEKYSGSYEQIAKTIYAVTTNKIESMAALYKTIVMSYLLKNGDGHLKNFGVLYDETFNNISFAPAYDIVNTCVYIFNDKPALTMFGKKLWFGKKELIKFGVEHCYLSKTQSQILYTQCQKALEKSIETVAQYIKTNPEFSTIGTRMIESWKVSQKQETHKELHVEVTRHWSKD